jgi:hypothetical protein
MSADDKKVRRCCCGCNTLWPRTAQVARRRRDDSLMIAMEGVSHGYHQPGLAAKPWCFSCWCLVPLALLMGL